MKKTQKLRVIIEGMAIQTTVKDIRKNFDHRINAFLDLLEQMNKKDGTQGLGSNVSGVNLQIDLIND